MTFLVWPFVESDETWKTFNVVRPIVNSLPGEWTEWDWVFADPTPTVTFHGPFDWPVSDDLKDSQFRLSSNFNSRKVLGKSWKRFFRTFPKSMLKRHSIMGKIGKPFPKVSKIRKILACRPPVFKKHEYVESGNFRTVRRFDLTKPGWVETKVPIMVRKIKLIPGARKGNLNSNALWFEEHTRDCSAPLNVVSSRRSEDVGFIPGSYVPLGVYSGPWCSFPLIGSGHWGARFNLIGAEFLEASGAAISPKLDYAAELQLLDDKVVAKLYSKVLNQKVDLATALAEGAKSVNMIADLLMRLIKFFLGLYRLNFSKAFSGFSGLVRDLLPLSKKKLASDFLAYRYGITPLISDIAGSVEEIADYFESEPKVYARSRSRAEVDNSSFIPEPMSFGFERLKFEDKLTFDITYKVTYKIKDLGNQRLARLGFTNPINVNWELVPFSFVLDWFLPIGNYLRDMSSFDHLTVHECTRTTVVKHNRVYAYFHDGVSGGELPDDILQGAFWVWETSDVWCYREIIPVPTLPLPSFKNPFSVGHVLNGIALLVQLFSKRK